VSDDPLVTELADASRGQDRAEPRVRGRRLYGFDEFVVLGHCRRREAAVFVTLGCFAMMLWRLLWA
jgi:hypothetical protein